MEEPKKKSRLVRKILLRIVLPLLLAIVIGFCVFVWVALSADDAIYTNTDTISDAIGSLQPRVIILDAIEVKTQPTATTCGITAVAVMSNYFNHTDYEALDLMEKYSTRDVSDWLQGELEGRTTVFHANGSNDAMIRDIHASLCDGKPVLIYFGAPNPYNAPYYDFHGSVVYGMNLDSETILIANVYGYCEELSLVDFLNQMAFAETRKYPFIQRFVLKCTKSMDKNMYYLVVD